MTDLEYYSACAIAALRELIAKVPLADKHNEDDADAVGLDICKSADRYASDMVRVRRERFGTAQPMFRHA